MLAATLHTFTTAVLQVVTYHIWAQIMSSVPTLNAMYIRCTMSLYDLHHISFDFLVRGLWSTDKCASSSASASPIMSCSGVYGGHGDGEDGTGTQKRPFRFLISMTQIESLKFAEQYSIQRAHSIFQLQPDNICTARPCAGFSTEEAR